MASAAVAAQIRAETNSNADKQIFKNPLFVALQVVKLANSSEQTTYAKNIINTALQIKDKLIEAAVMFDRTKNKDWQAQYLTYYAKLLAVASPDTAMTRGFSNEAADIELMVALQENLKSHLTELGSSIAAIADTASDISSIGHIKYNKDAGFLRPKVASVEYKYADDKTTIVDVHRRFSGYEAIGYEKQPVFKSALSQMAGISKLQEICHGSRFVIGREPGYRVPKGMSRSEASRNAKVRQFVNYEDDIKLPDSRAMANRARLVMFREAKATNAGHVAIAQGVAEHKRLGLIKKPPQFAVTPIADVTAAIAARAEADALKATVVVRAGGAGAGCEGVEMVRI